MSCIRSSRSPFGSRSADRSRRLTLRQWPPSSGGHFPPIGLPAAHYDWTGFSIGAHVDGSWSNVSSTVNTATGTPAAPGDVNPSGWHGGIQLGYDYMMPSRVVLGMRGGRLLRQPERRPRSPTPPATSCGREQCLRQRNRARAPRLRRRQRPALRNRRPGLVKQSIHPHPAGRHAQPRDTRAPMRP